MKSVLLIAALISVFLLVIVDCEACKGCLSLDEFNFDKILSRFDAVLVKFDVAYPYGDKHEAFAKLASELASTQDLIFAQVGIKDYGDKENEELARRFGITKDDLPALRLFTKKRSVPVVEHSQNADWSIEALRNLVRDNTDIYIGLPGCVQRFDELAAKFVRARDKSEVIKEAEKAVKGAESESDKTSGEFYVKYMKKVVEAGSEFITQETSRLAKILKDGKMNEKKKVDLEHRLNILRSFALPKDEL